MSDETVDAVFNTETAKMYVQNCGKKFRKNSVTTMAQMPTAFSVPTKEGVMSGQAGDWMALDADGDPYPLANSIQEKTYVPARKSRAKE